MIAETVHFLFLVIAGENRQKTPKISRKIFSLDRQITDRQPIDRNRVRLFSVTVVEDKSFLHFLTPNSIT
jgi:hypothetical protein